MDPDWRPPIMKCNISLCGTLLLPLVTLLSSISNSPANAQTQPTLTVIYTFVTSGEPTALVEVSPGKFFGLAVIGSEIFSLSAAGNYQALYNFPTVPTSIGPIGLTPALDGRTYGSAANSGPVTTFSELFSVAADGTFAAYPYNGTTQGGTGIPVQAPDNHLYSIFGVAGGPTTFDRLNYSGTPSPVYVFHETGYPAFGALFLGQGGDFYGLWLNSNTSAGIYSITPAGAFSWIVPS